MRRKSHLSKPPKRRRHTTASNGLSSKLDSGQDSLSRDSMQDQDEDDGDHMSSASSFDSLSHDSVRANHSSKMSNSSNFTYNFNLDDSLPLTDQVKRFHPGAYESYESMHWPHPQVYDYINIHPECCVEEEDFNLIKKQLDMEHIGKCIDWDEERWYSDTVIKKENLSPSHNNFSDDSCQDGTYSANGTHHSVRVLPSGEVVSSVEHTPALQSSEDFHTNIPSPFNEHGYHKKGPQPPEFCYKELVEIKPRKSASRKGSVENKPDNDVKHSVLGHECDKCGTLLKTSNKMKDHLERHKQLESLRKHAGHLPSREQLVKEVPVLVNRALKGIMDEPAVSSLEKRVEAYAKRLYYNSFPLWKEISKELVHEVWQHVTLTELTLLPAVDWDFFVWSRNVWLTSGGRREGFVLNLLFLYPDDSEVVEVFFYKFFVKLNDAVYKFAMRCLGSPDVVSDSNRFEPDIRPNQGLEELHTLCSLVLKTYLKRASQNKAVKGWNAIYKCIKRNFVENSETGKPPKSSEMLQWALGQSNHFVTTKSAFRFFSLISAVIDNISKVNPQCEGPVAQHKMVLRAVYLRQDIVRAWDKLVASSHFEEMDSLYVLEMLVKSFAFFSGCASARKLKQNGAQ